MRRSAMGGMADTGTLRPVPGAKIASAGASIVKAGAGIKAAKFFLAIALIPACVAFTLAVQEHFFSAWQRLNAAVFGPSESLRYFGVGAAMFATFAILVSRPIAVYVFGHEVTHALATWLCLGSVKSLAASARGGQVVTSKTNTFIRLAPYAIPFYVLVAIALHVALQKFWPGVSEYRPAVAATLGAAYAFHIGFTLWSLRREQPDLQPDGWLFSMVLIYLANVLVFATLMGYLFEGPAGAWASLKECAVAGGRRTLQIAENLISLIRR